MPTSDNFTGINETNVLAAQQDSDSRLEGVLQNNPKQFVDPNSIQQPEAPKGLYGTVNPGDNINLDKTSYAYQANDYNNQMAGLVKKYPGSNTLPDIRLPQSETDRFTGNDYGFKVDRNNESFYANQQGFGKVLANSLVNFVGKTAAYAVQNAGFIVGAPVAAGTANISNMTDNFLTRAGDWLKDKVSADFPIYKSDKYTNGNIFDKLGTAGWWFDDGMDRVALTAAMFLPGMAETKGLGLFGTALDEAGNLRATGMASKALQALADSPQEYGKLGKTFLAKLYNAAANGVADTGVQPALRSYAQNLSRAELYTWNVIGQSGLNAKETQEAVMKATGDKDKAANAAVKSFWETVPLALAGSLIEIPQMFSTKNTAKSVLDKIFDKETGETIEESLALKGDSIGKTLLKSVLTGFEHGQNESMQVAVSRYNEDAAQGKDPRGTIKGIFGDYLDNLHDPNGQNNIALGTIQGILMTLGGKGFDKFVTHQTENENKQAISLLNYVNQAKIARRIYNGDFNVRDEKGEVIPDENGYPIKDQQKMAAAGASLAGVQIDLELKRKALETGNYTAAAAVDHRMLAGFAQNFFDDANGMQHLINILKLESKANEDNPDRINDFDGQGNEITPQVQLQRNLETVKELKQIHDAIEQRHGGFMNLDVDKKNKDEIKQATSFIQDVKDSQYKQASDQIFLRKQVDKNDKEKQWLGVDVFANLEPDRAEPVDHFEDPGSPLEERFNELTILNKHLKDLLEENKGNYKLLINKKAQKQAFNIDKQIKNKTENKAEETQTQQQKNNEVQPTVTNPAPQDQTQTPASAQPAATVQTPGTPEAEVKPTEKSPAQQLLDKRNEDLANAQTPAEKAAIGQQYLKDLSGLNKQNTPVKSEEETGKRVEQIKKLIPNTKTIHADELTKLSNLVNEESKKGNISPAQEEALLNQLNDKKVIGTPFNTEADIEDEASDIPEDKQEEEEGQNPDIPDSETDQVTTENNNQDIQGEQDYDPSTVDIQDPNLDESAVSSLAYQTSNKTVTQEEGQGPNGFNNTLDEDPYKQFIQGYLRSINQNGIPVGGIHGKIIKDNDSLPHSEDTKKYLEDLKDQAHNLYDKIENYEGVDDDGNKITAQIRTNKQGKKVLYISGKGIDDSREMWHNINNYPASTENEKILKGVVYEGKKISEDNSPDNSYIENKVRGKNSYGSVLVITDGDRNILNFDENYNSSPDPVEGSKPVVFSFNSQAWDGLKNARAIIGEERTGISAENFLNQYQTEKEQQELARQLAQQGKEVNVEIKGVSKGVIRKSKTPMKASDVISESMKPTLYIPSSIDKFDPNNPDATKYVIAGNKALINGGLYAETLDSKSGVISYTRLIPNLITDIPTLFDNIRNLLNHTYDNKNEATLVRDHLKEILFLGKVKRPNLTITENEDGSEYNIRLLQDGNLIDPEATFTFLLDQRLNILKGNVENDTYNDISIKDGKLKTETKSDYKNYILQNSTTVDIPVKTSEGDKFIPLNTYAYFDFLDSPDSMKQNLTKKKATTPEESSYSFAENETPVFRHGQNKEDVTSKNSGKSNTPLNEDGKKEAESIGKIFKSLGIKKIIYSPILRTMETAQIAGKRAGVKSLIGNSLLETWDIGDFTGQPDSLFNERWFVNNPDAIEKDGKKLGETFDRFLNRMIKAYVQITDNTDNETGIVAHSRNIRVWNAIKENNGFWNDNAKELYLNQTDNFAHTSIVRKEEKADNSTLTKQPLRRLKAAPQKNAEDIAREQDQADKDKLEGLKAIEDSRENRPLITQSEINEVNRIFGQKVAEKVNDIVNSDARALWTMSGIKLFRDARQGDGYHEAWHHFSQMYLTQEEKRGLYDEARKKAVNFTTRDNRKLNSKGASDFDLEEFIADDFRDYVNSEGKSRLVDRPYRNNIFRKIIDFLRKFFFGDIKIDKLYDDLYRGNLSHYEPSINNAMWGKLNSKAINKDGNEIVDNQKASYYRDLIDYYMGEQLLAAKTSVDALRKNTKLAEAIYTNIYSELVNKHYNPMLDRADKGEDINQVVAEDLFNVLSNWEAFVDYHKNASKLFLNIQHELRIDVPENPEDQTVDTEVGSDNNEIKDETEDTFGENEVDGDVMQSDKLYDVSGNEKSSIQAASVQTRGLIRMLPAMDWNNGNPKVELDENGFPRLNDYARTWNNIAYKLSNLDSYSEMIQRLNNPNTIKDIPEVSVLLEHLPNPSKDHTPSEINTITAFRTDFNRAYIGIYSGKMYPDKGYQLNEETKRNNDAVRKVWTANFYNKLNSDPDVSGGRILIDEETGKYYLNPEVSLAYNMQTPVGRDSFMKLIGMNFSDDAKRNRFYITELPKYLNDIQGNINARHALGEKIYNPLFDIRNDIKDPESKEIIVKGLSQVIKGLVNFQSKYATDVPSLSYQTATGEMIYGLSLNHTLSITANNLNKTKSYQDIIDNPALQHLNFNNNHYVRGSIFLDHLFDLNTGRRKTDNILIVGNYNGFKTVDNDGNTVGYSTTDLNVRQKAIFDINSLLSKGIIEVMRTESSKSAYFVKMYHYNNLGDVSRAYLPIPFSHLPEGFQAPMLMKYMIDNYLYDELDRIKNASNVEAYKSDPKLMQAAQGFNLFRDILRSDSKDPESLKNALKSDIEKFDPEKTIERNREAIENAVVRFFDRELASFKEGLAEENITADDIARNLPSKSYEQQLRTFIANDFLLNVEYTKLFNGDTIYQAQYKDYFKRSKGDISTGKTPMTDDLFVRHMRSIEGNTFGAFIGSTIPNDYKTFRTLNFKDDVRDSKYLDIYQKDLLASDPSLKKEDIDKWLDKYKGMKIADGQGYVTLDFYRQFLKSINNWSDDQESGYQQELARYKLANKDFNPEYSNDMKERDRNFLQKNPQNFSYYPPLKIQYNGPIQAIGTFAPVMDKFSVVPIIPSIVKGTPLEQMHNEMLKAGISYAKYVSGTKKYIHPPIEIYNENGFTNLDLSKHTPAVHFLDYLKEQINTNPKVKQESIFGSQIRKLIEANLFSNGISDKADSDRHDRYKSYIKGITDLAKKELFDKIGLKQENGKIGIGDMKKFISALQEQADLRELNDNIKEYIQLDKDTGKLKYALETSLNRRAIQDMLMGIVDKIRVQKLSGDQLIQVSSSGFQPNNFKYTNATDEDIKKYGTNGLRFYHLNYDQNGKPQNIIAAQIKVSLTGSFEKLLLKTHTDGNRIGTIERLNELLKDDNWIKENQKSITLIGYRIPTQGHNSMEHMIVAEFLPPRAGSIVIVPAEIVAKSGSDFDIDKLSIFRPSFDNNGNLIDDESKEGYSNKIINLFSEILSDPKNFKQLIRPNDTDLVKPETNDVAVAIGKRSASDVKESKPYSGTQIYRYKTNLRKFETLLSAKKLLSIFAVNNTFTTVMQQAGTQQNLTYGLAEGINRNVRLFLMSPKERAQVVKDGKLNLGYKYSVDGNFKQDFYSQLINATVDAASDDFFGYVNMSYENVNVLCHLINQGVPFDRAIWFLNQPVLLRYYSDMRKREKGQSKDSIKATILGQLNNKNYFKTNAETGRVSLDRKPYNTDINKILDDPKYSQLFLSKNVLKKYTKKTKDVDTFLNEDAAKKYNAIVFSYFISLQEQAQLFRDLQKVSSYDTTKIASPTVAYSLFATAQQIKANKMFDDTEVGKISDKSIIGAFDNKRLVATIGAAMMPVAFNPYFMSKSVLTIQANTQYSTRTAQKKFINNYETQWIEYVVKSLGKIGDRSLYQYGKYLQEGKNNLGRRFNDLMGKYPELKSDYALVNKLRPNFPNTPLVKKSNIEVSRLFENTTDDQNRYIAEFRNLINLDSKKYTPEQTLEIQKFFKDLAILGFVQSGFSKSNISFQDIVPQEELADIFKTTIDNFNEKVAKDKTTLDAYIKEFQAQFVNNQKGAKQPWRGRDYFLSDPVNKLIKNRMTQPEAKKAQINQQPTPQPYENKVEAKYVDTTNQKEVVNITQVESKDLYLKIKKLGSKLKIGDVITSDGKKYQVWDGSASDAAKYGMNDDDFGDLEGVAIREVATGQVAYVMDQGFLKDKNGNIFVGEVTQQAQDQRQQDQLLLPEVKTERQYWPGYEMQESAPEFDKAIGKAMFKNAMENLDEDNTRDKDQEYYFANVPDNFTKQDFDKLLESADYRKYDENLSSDNFEKAYNLYKKFGDFIFADKDGGEMTFSEIGDNLQEIEVPTSDGSNVKYSGGLSDILREYQRRETPDDLIDEVEKILSDYGLLKYRDYNPKQLSIPFKGVDEEAYNKQINEILNQKDKGC